MFEFLTLLSDGQEHSVSEAKVALGALFDLTTSDRNDRSPQEKLFLFERKFGWARSYLKSAGLVVAPRRGIFRITENGSDVVRTDRKEQVLQYLSEIPNFLYHKDRGEFSVSDAASSDLPKVERVKRKVPASSSSGTAQPKTELKMGYVRTLDSVPGQSSAPQQAKPWNIVVEVLFGTDRKEIPAATPGKKFTSERGDFRFGVARVSIPERHKVGAIERPKWYLLEFAENPAKHITLLAADTMDLHDFRLKTSGMTQAGIRTAFVFVHGYNVSFKNAALRTAQIAFDLGLKSIPTFYSWPSQDSAPKYTVDEQSVEWTEPHLQQFLTEFADASSAEEIFVVAHSMGARAATRAVGHLHSIRPDLSDRFREVILAAPDIDADVFRRDLLPALTKELNTVTLYASSKDKALNASKKVHGNPRAGGAGPELVLHEGLETIDASNIDTDFLAHSYFAKTRALLTDLALLINNNMRAGERPHLEKITVRDCTYWAFNR